MPTKYRTLPLERLRHALAYDPITGVLTHCAPTRGHQTGVVAGVINAKGYRDVWVLGSNWRSARLAWALHYGEWPTKEVDHINGDRADDRIDNLRQATRIENIYNTGRNGLNTSGAKGVSFNTRKQKWIAQIAFPPDASGRQPPRYLGQFDTIEEASAAYVQAARPLHGEFFKEGVNG